MLTLRASLAFASGAVQALSRCPVAADVLRAADRVRDWIVPRAVGVVWVALGRLPRNGVLWAYPILGTDGSRYVDRAILPRVLGRRVVIHRIHRADRDPWTHDHPWRTARFLILSGGYVEERIAVGGGRQARRLRPGDVNRLDAGEFHRIVHVEPGTCTVGLLGDRCRDWGLLVDDRDFVLAERYFARVGYTAQGVRS